MVLYLKIIDKENKDVDNEPIMFDTERYTVVIYEETDNGREFHYHSDVK